MTDAVEYLDADEYGKLNGLWYSITFAPSVLFVGYLTESANRTNMLGMSVLVAGIVTFANSFVTDLCDASGNSPEQIACKHYEIYYLYALRALLGFA